MRKHIFPAMLFAIGSLASYSAACPMGPVVLSSLTSSCTIGGWSIGGFSLDASSSAWGYLGEPSTSNFMVDIAAAPAITGYGPGFSVSFSAAASGPNFLIASSGNPNQSSTFKTLYNIESGPVLAESQVSADIGTVSDQNNGSIVVQAGTGDPSLSGNPTFANATILTLSSYQSLNPISLSGFAGNSLSQFSVFNNIQLASGNSGTASLTGFTNYFYAPQSSNGDGVPEPMTFALLGGGLIAITALRRRK